MNRHTDDRLYTADCPQCQAALASTDLDTDLDKIWTGIITRLWPTQVGRLAGSRDLEHVLTLLRRSSLRIRLTLHTGLVNERRQAAPWHCAGGKDNSKMVANLIKENRRHQDGYNYDHRSVQGRPHWRR